MFLKDLEQLIDYYPTTDNQRAVKALLDDVKGRFESKGLVTQSIIHDGIHGLYASTTGNKHTKILLQSHADVVPGQQPFRVDSDKVYGRGSNDMLFAIAAYLRLLDELGDQLKSFDLGIMLSGDEEVGGFSGVGKMVEEDGFTADVCILPDAGNGFGTMNVSSKGVYQPIVQINGVAHHGARPWEGESAALKLVNFVKEVETIFDMSEQPNSTVTVSQLKAGEAMNRGPAAAEVGFDIRYKNAEDFERIHASLVEIMGRYNGEFLDEHQIKNFDLDLDNPYIKMFVTLYEKHLGHPVEFTHANGSSDARFFDDKHIPVIMICPDGGGTHGDDEWTSLLDFERCYALLKEYVITVLSK